MERFKKRLVTQYQDRHLLSKQEQVIPLRGDKLVKLTLVEGEKQEGYAAEWQRGKEDCDKIKQSPIERNEIFKPRKRKKDVKRVLAEGEAGIGKSTFCTTLSEKWANEQLLQQFKLVLHLPLREKEIASAESVYDLLKFFHKRVDESVATEIEDDDGKDVLLILDGWDELSEENRQSDSFVYGLLVGDELYDASVLLTSRPSASADLHRLRCIDRCIEIVGFDEQTIAEYVESEFADDKKPTEASRLLSELERNPLVANLCTVPLNCAIICFLWRKPKREYVPSTVSLKQQQLPSTMTDLYKEIVFKIILRDIHNRHPEYKKCLPHLTSFDSLPEHLQSSFWKLCEFAFRSIEEDQLVFSHDELANKGIVSVDESYGLLQATITPSGEHKSFHFLHLTFQEYLAALHLVKQLPNTQFQHARSHHFQIVWRFFFGVGFMPKPISVQLKTLTVEAALPFLEWPASHYVMMRAEDESQMLCHCAFESKNGVVSSLIAQSLHQAFPQNVHDCTAIVHVISHTKPGSRVNISFDGCNLGDRGIIDFAGLLVKKLGEVQVYYLGIGGNRLTSKGFAALLSRATKDAFQQSILLISCAQNKIEDIGSMRYILPSSSSSPLSDLNLSHNPLNSSSLQMLAEVICSNKLANLEALQLEGCLIHDPNVDANVSLLLSLACCPKLKQLNLSENNLSLEEVQALGKVVSQLSQGPCKQLELFLKRNNFSDKGVFAFTQSITGSCNLQSISLNENNIHADGALCLADSIASSALCVESIDLSNNPLGLGGAVAV